MIHAPRSMLHGCGNRGQTMLLVVMMISGTILSISLVAGILMVYQIRQAGNFTNSAKAIFAADTGVGWWFFSQTPAYNPSYRSSTINAAFGNGASFEIVELPNGTAKVVGQAGNSKRAFLVEPLSAVTCNPNPDIMLVIDKSLSIESYESDYEDSLRTYINYLSALTSNQAYFGLEVFNGSPSLIRPLSNNSSSIRLAITNMNYGGESNGANLDDAIDGAQAELEGLNDRDDNQYKDYLLIVTDSVPSPANQANVNTAANAAKTAGTKIIVIGIDPDPSEGPSFHGYFESLASPGHYASSTGNGTAPYEQNLIERLRSISNSTFLNCP
ncbi:MAG: vWA domain-containing protein [Patescibacteria group bacterium]